MAGSEKRAEAGGRPVSRRDFLKDVALKPAAAAAASAGLAALIASLSRRGESDGLDGFLELTDKYPSFNGFAQALSDGRERLGRQKGGVSVSDGLLYLAVDSGYSRTRKTLEYDDLAKFRKRMDEFTSGLAGEASRACSLEAKAGLISKRIRERGLRPTVKDKDIVSLMDPAVGEGSCEDVTSLYLACADEIGLNANPVAAPIHLFPRFHEGGRHVNVETMTGGTAITDRQYAKIFAIDEDALETGVYLSDRPMKSIIAAGLNNRATKLAGRMRDGGGSRSELYPIALSSIDLARKIDPRLPNLDYNEGSVRWLMGDKSSLNLFEKAMDSDPNNVRAYAMAASLTEALGDEDEASRIYGEGLKRTSLQRERIREPRRLDYLIRRENMRLLKQKAG